MSAQSEAADRLTLDVAARVRYWRLMRSLTQSEVAAELGTTQNTVSRWELGKNAMRVDDLARMAVVLGVAPSVLTS